MTPFHLYLYGPSRGAIDSSFEELEGRLIMLPLLDFEPDGSFVWARDAGQLQIFGMVYDAEGMVRYCDLQGRCLYQTWRELCVAIAGGACDRLEVMSLPDRQLQDLQTFEKNLWPETSGSQG